MKTSSDMMAEDWYQKAIHQGAMPVLTPARKSDSQWVISVTQELVDAKGANLGVLRLDISYETLEAYLNQLQLGQRALPLSSMKTMNLSTILNIQFTARLAKWRP